jgi:ATP-dependent DNA helicase RecQ
MTADAKWVINCIAEAGGRYGQNIIIGTLLGANRARLKEVGATSYKSYGALSHRSEADLKLLMEQMLEAGYITQTDDRYSVIRIGDISPLRDEAVHVTIRKFEEHELPKKSSTIKKRSSDALTGAGFNLFEKLRQLRLVIAKEEAMPPYIIFSDKTLIDMCVKLPWDKQTMLAVSGVGENKYNKYGQRFLDEIAEYVAQNPGVVTGEAGE